MFAADWCEKAPFRPELFEQHLRQVGKSNGAEDAVKGSIFRPALPTIVTA